MSGFSIGWLDLRERADQAARNKDISALALQWIAAAIDPAVPEPLVVDLGSGTGSTLRALTKLGIGRIVWRLVDHDGALLDEALRRHRKTHCIEDYQADLGIVAELPLAAARLVTASALFDLASRSFIDQLVAKLASNRNGLYAALSYDGTMRWQPVHPLDADVLAAFNQDQQRDKGFGPALGPAATDYLEAVLKQAGYSTVKGSSPWLLQADEQALVRELVTGIAAAVCEGYGLDAVLLEEWAAFRLAHAASGNCEIGHLDMLALPVSGNA